MDMQSLLRPIAPLLLLLSALTAEGAGRLVYYDSITSLNDSTVPLHLPDSISRYDVEARGFNRNPRDRWGLGFRRHDGSTAIAVTLSCDSSSSPFNDSPETIVQVTDSTGATIFSGRYDKGFGTARGEENTLMAEVSGNYIRLWGGITYLSPIFEQSVSGAVDLTPCVTTEGELSLSTVAVETYPDRALLLATTLTPDSIAAVIATAAGGDTPVGYWSYLDGENDDRMARNGGRYRLAIIPDSDGGYLAIYLGGAEVNRHSWLPGMIKARLYPTRFRDHFETVWYDTEMRPVDHDVSASLEQGALLTISLPVYRTKLRFARE